MNYFEMEAQAARLDEQRRISDLSNSRADVPKEYEGKNKKAEDHDK